MAKVIKTGVKSSVVTSELDDSLATATLYSSVAALNGQSASVASRGTSATVLPSATVLKQTDADVQVPSVAVSGGRNQSATDVEMASSSPSFQVGVASSTTTVNSTSTTPAATSTVSINSLAINSSPIIFTGAGVTLDESSGLQNAATTNVAGDSNDNDISSGSLPASFSTRLAALGLGAPLGAAESGYNGVTGQNVFTIDPNTVITSIKLTDASGQVLNGLDSGLTTVDGRRIYLFNDSVDTNIVLGKTTGGDVAFAVYLQQQSSPVLGGQLWTTSYVPLFHPDATNPDDGINLAGKIFVTVDGAGTNALATATPGQHLFFMVGTADAGLVVTGYHPADQSSGVKVGSGDTVNVSNAGVGGGSVGTNNQMINAPTFDKSGRVTVPGEGMIFTFVTGPNPEYTGINLSQAEADFEANIQFAGLKNSDSAFFLVSQLQPIKAATLEITALSTGLETGVNYVNGLIVNDTPVNISRVVVMNSSGTAVADSNGSVQSATVKITFSGANAYVAGVLEGYQIQYYTVGTHNRVLIQNSGSTNPNLNASFDIGNFSFAGFTHASADVGSLISFEDAAPSVEPNTIVHLDDAALPGGSGGGAGDISNTTGTLLHSFGTDGAGSIAWLGTGAPAGFSYVVSGTTLLVKEAGTTVMTLTVDSATGAYTVMQNAALMHAPADGANSQAFAVSYVVTDKDSDPVNGVLNLTVKDDLPAVSSNLLVHLDDAALPGGSGGGSGDVQNVTGTLAHTYGADNAGSIAWLTTGAPAGFTYEASGSDLLVKEAGVTVLTLTMDSTSGSYTVTQNAALMHAPADGANSQAFAVSYVVTDKDSDPVNGVLNLTVKDDLPAVSSNLLVHLDDAALPGGSGGGSGDLQNITGTLAHSYGADNAGSIAWLTTGAPAGFTYEASGSDLLVKEAGTTVMTLTVDSATGAYTVTQNAALMHAPADGANSQAFAVSYVVTDKDSDPVNGVLNLTVKDDLPAVSSNLLVHLDDAALPGGSGGGSGDVQNITGTLAHNYGADNAGSIAWLTTGAPAGFTYEASGSDLLVKEAGVTVLTLTMDSTSGSYTVTQNAALMHAPADGANSQAFAVSYVVTDKDSDPVNGVLNLTVKDDLPAVSSNLLVHLDDAALPGGSGGGSGDVQNITGTLAHNYGADNAGSIVWLTTGAPAGFTYEASGSDLLVKEAGVTVLTLTMDSTSGSYTVTQNAALMHAPADGANSQAFAVSYVVTDKDSDPVNGVLNLTVKDDLPAVSSNLLVHLDDAALPGGSGGGSGDVQNITGTLAHNYGADSAGSIAWLTTGAPAGFTYESSGTNLLVKEAGMTVLTLTVDAVTGAYTVTQNAALMHAPADGANSQAFAVSYVVTDKDSDPVNGVLNLTVKDDLPAVSSNLLVHLDDAALPGGSGGGSGDVQNITGTLAHNYGADNAGSIVWLTTGAPAGFTYEASGSDLLVKEAGVTVLTLTMDSTSGSYTVTQNAALMHAPADGANSQAFAVSYVVTDKDSDPVNGVLNLTVKDDLPAVSSNLLVHLDDAALPGGSGGGSGDVQNITGTLAHNYGADNAGSIAWLTTGAPAGFTYEASGSDLLVKEAGTTVMTLSVDSETGAYTVVQNAALMHAPADGANSQAFAVSYVVTDKDSDPVNGVLNLTVKDDLPAVSSNLLVHLDDAALPGGSGGGSGDLQNITGTLAHSYGADNAGSISWLTTGAPAGFTYEVIGSDLLVKEAGTTVMTLTVDSATGAYTVTQNAALMHAPADGANSQAFAVSYVVTDKDSDPVNGVLNLTVKDDLPAVSSNLLVHLDDAALPGGSGGGSGDVQNVTGTLAHTYGADNAGSIAWLTTGAPAGFTYEASGSDLLVKEAGVTVLTLTMDSTSGSYTVTQNAALMHAPADGANSQAFAVSYVVTDKDSDPVNGVLNLTVKDDLPAVSSNLLVHLDDAALPGGSGGGSGDVQNITGTLAHNYGADSAGSIAWLTTGAPAGFTYEASGSDLLVKEAGVTVLTLTMDSTSGSYTVTQNAALMHAPADGANSQAFAVSYVVTDKDSDPVNGVLNLTVKDDLPSVSSNLLVHLDDAALPGGSGSGSGDVQNITGTLAHNYGADSAGSIAWLTTGAPAGFTYEVIGSDLLVKEAGTTVMTLTVDSATGAYTVMQNAALMHAPADGANSQAFAVSYVVTDKDSDPVNGVLNLTVKDDLPAVSSNLLVHLDDAALPGGSGSGSGDVQNITGTLAHNYGADSAGSIAWLTTGAPAGFTYEASGTNLLVKEGGTTVMTLGLDSITGSYTVVQNAAVLHAPGAGTNSQGFTVGYVVTDLDGDSTTGSLGISVKDDVPVIHAISDVSYANTNNPTPGGTGVFSYSIGADQRTSFSSSDSDFSIFSLLGQVGKNSITNSSVLWTSENPYSATFSIAFDYQPNEYSTNTQHATGTLSFNKTAGTYSIALNAPIDSYSISTTSSALAFIGYVPGSSTVDHTQPEVSVAQLSTNLFAQFTGVSEPGGGTGSNNLEAVGVDGSNSTFVDGELFTQAAAWVSTTNLANGVAGDTLQKGEVLTFNLFNSNPYGYLNTSANVEASSMFLKFDGVGKENLVVVLKLEDSTNHSQTTKALVIDSSDILKAGNTVTPNYGINLDSNDGAIVIESNDFNSTGQHYLITGAQILTSTENITGTGIDFNGAIGAAGASTGTQQMGVATTDNDVIKVSDIGIVTQNTSTLDANLHIALAVKDTDVDPTLTQTLNVLITGSGSVTPIALDMNGDGFIQYLDRSAGVMYDYGLNGHALSTAWVGPHDGLLAIRQPDQTLNISFSTQVGETDLQGLAKVYDTNHDNVLSALDTQFKSFGVWQDVSSNGKVESGEFMALDQAGISRISLVSNHATSTSANGQVLINGESTFTKVDGSVGKVDDASFNIGDLTLHSVVSSAEPNVVSSKPVGSVEDSALKLTDVIHSTEAGTTSVSSNVNAGTAPIITLSDLTQSSVASTSSNTNTVSYDVTAPVSVAAPVAVLPVHEEVVHVTI